MNVTDDDDFFVNVWPRKCACGASYTQEQWQRLKLVSVSKMLPDDSHALDYRDCPCKSTLAIYVVSENS